MSNSRLKILIADDHRLFADGLAMIVQRLPYQTDIHIVNNVRPLLNNLDRLKTFDLILVDLQMPTVDGISFLTSLKLNAINTAIVVVSSTENVSEIERSLEMGASGFIPKNAHAEIMLEGIIQVLEGNRFVPEHLISAISWPKKITNSKFDQDLNVRKITERQTQVLTLMHAGKSNGEIAQILSVSESAIKGHVSRLFRLLGAKNRTACVRAALDENLIGH